MTFKDQLQALTKQRAKLEKVEDALAEDAQQLCDFDVHITWLADDGYLLLCTKNDSVASFDVLNGKTRSNKLSYEEFRQWTF